MCRLLPVFVALLLFASSYAQPRKSSRSAKADEKEDVEPETKKVEVAVKEVMEELKLADQLQNEPNSTRESRGLLKKVAFLAGMKLGGMVESSGTLAASNSMRIFGKVVNSALSVSYGSVNDVDPIPGIDEFGGIGPQKQIKGLNEASKPAETVAAHVATREEVPLQQAMQLKRNDLEQSTRLIKTNFINKHNTLVNRANSKFFRIARDKKDEKVGETKSRR